MGPFWQEAGVLDGQGQFIPVPVEHLSGQYGQGRFELEGESE